jgi:hypothetical protein
MLKFDITYSIIYYNSINLYISIVVGISKGEIWNVKEYSYNSVNKKTL